MKIVRITTARIVSQAFFFAAFLGLFTGATYVMLARSPRLIGWVSKFLEIDPLVGFATAVTTGTIYSGLIFSLVILVLTIALGRVFCNWVCPFGTLHHFAGWAFGRHTLKGRLDVNRYRSLYAVKYYILVAMLIAALFGTLQVGLLDPIATIHRSFTVAVMPGAQMAGPGWLAWLAVLSAAACLVLVVIRLAAPTAFGKHNLGYTAWVSGAGALVFAGLYFALPLFYGGDYRMYHLAWLIGVMLIALVAMNLVIPRFFCRVLCPLGAFLGAFSRFSLWRIDRDPGKCTNCGLCKAHCEGACDPQGSLRKSECLVCFNCVEACPHGALSFAYLPPQQGEISLPDLDRRKVLYAGLAGLAFVPLMKSAGKSTKAFDSHVVRPPGSLEEQEFLKRCIKCGQCMRVCPTNVLQPAMLESGIEGVWTPVMNYRIGACQLNCTACGQVCPTGAIRRITVEEKLGLGKYAAAGPVRMGLANYDLGRCLPWGKATPCVVCEEVCPVSPKAIYSEWQQFVMREGKKMVTAATADTVTLAEFPKGGQTRPEPAVLRPGSLRGDDSQHFYAKLLHPDGSAETHRIAGNGVDTVQIQGVFSRVPKAGDIVALLNEVKVPKIDLNRCIGCGLCEKECVIVGDKRGVYVTAEGETRSHGYHEQDRSIRLIKSQD